MSECLNWCDAHNEICKISDNFDLHAKRIQSLLEQGYTDESIILIVVIFEVLLKDLFKTCRGAWIHCGKGSDISHMNLDDKLEARKKIMKYLEDVRAYDKFLKNYYVYQCDDPYPETETLYQTLFGKTEVINFQNIKNNDGAHKAYKVFFDINLMKMLDTDEKSSYKKWKLLQELIEQRHQIVHSGESTTLIKEEIGTILQSLIFMKNSLEIKCLSFYGIPRRMNQ